MAKPNASVEGEALVSDGILATLEHIGEGRNGDFVPTDAEDARMLRLDVFPDKDDNEAWEGASFCTGIRADATREVRQMALEHAVATARSAIAADVSLGRALGPLSAMTADDFAHGVFVGRGEILDTHGDLGVGRVIDEYVNFGDEPLGVATYVCEFGIGDDVTHADRIDGEFTRDAALIAAARLGTASPSP